MNNQNPNLPKQKKDMRKKKAQLSKGMYVILALLILVTASVTVIAVISANRTEKPLPVDTEIILPVDTDSTDVVKPQTTETTKATSATTATSAKTATTALATSATPFAC